MPKAERPKGISTQDSICLKDPLQGLKDMVLKGQDGEDYGEWRFRTFS